jgi:hypothetical protein
VCRVLVLGVEWREETDSSSNESCEAQQPV